MKTISKPTKIKLDGQFYLLEEGDRIDVLPGGKADEHDVESIAKKHGVDVELIEKQLEMGKKVELEHTDDDEIAAEISLDHLEEIPDYYTRLAKMEKEAGIEESKEFGDIITEVEGFKINNENSMFSVFHEFRTGQTIRLLTIRDDEEIIKKMKLEKQ